MPKIQKSIDVKRRGAGYGVGLLAINLFPAFLLFLFWIIITASFSLINIVLGITCSFLVAVIARSVLAIGLDKDITIPVLIRLPFFTVVLMWEIVKANVNLALILMNPRLPIDPRIIRYKTNLKGELGRTVFANSITLTPGTVTVDVQDDILYVHCLATHHWKGLLGGRFERMVAWLFQQKLGEQNHVGELVV